MANFDGKVRTPFYASFEHSWNSDAIAKPTINFCQVGGATMHVSKALPCAHERIFTLPFFFWQFAPSIFSVVKIWYKFSSIDYFVPNNPQTVLHEVILINSHTVLGFLQEFMQPWRGGSNEHCTCTVSSSQEDFCLKSVSEIELGRDFYFLG